MIDLFKTTTDTSSILSATNFVVDPSIKLSPDKFTDSSLANASITSYSFTTGLSSLLESQIESKPKDISYQVLIEPLKAVSPGVLSNAAIGTASNLANAFVASSKDSLKRAAELSQNPSAVDNEINRACTDAAAKKCSTLALTEANQAEASSGRLIFSASTDMILAGNSMKLHSDTNIFTRSPYVLTNTQDHHVVANNSIVNVSDVSLAHHKNSSQFIEGSHAVQSANSVNISTENRDVIARNVRSIGIAKHETIGDTTSVIANSNLVQASQGTISSTARGTHEITSGGDMTILVSPSASSIDEAAKILPHALTDVVEQAVDEFASLNIIHSTKTSKNITTFTEGGISSSTNASYVVLSNGPNYQTGSDTFSIASSNGMSFYGNQQAGTLVIGNFIWNGAPAPLPAIPIPLLTNIPLIPSLPSLPTKQLEACIPDSLKKKTQGSSIEEAIANIEPNPNTSLDSPGPFSKQESPAKIFTSRLDSKNNPKQLARSKDLDAPISSSQKTLSAVAIDKNSSLSISHNNNKDNSPSSISNAIDTEGNTAAQIYLSADSEVDYVLGDFKITSNSFSSTINDLDLSNLTTSLTQQNITDLTNSVINNTKSILPKGFDLNQNQVLFIKSNLDIFKSRDYASIRSIAKSINLDIESLVNLLEVDVPLNTAFIKAVETALLVPGIGFLGSILGLVSNVTNVYSKIPTIIKSGGLNNYIKLANSVASNLPLPPSIKNVLNLGQLVTDPKATTKDIVSNITASLVSSLNLSIDQNTLSTLTSLIYNKGLKDSEIDSLISTYIPGVTNTKLKEVFKLLSEGKVSAALVSSNLEGIISSVIGTQNAANISTIKNIFKDGKSLVSSINAIPQMLKLLNQYKVPTLQSISIGLSCLDLFNKIKNLIQDFSALDFSSPQSTATNPIVLPPESRSSPIDSRLIAENLPRYIQLINSVKSVPGIPNKDFSLSDLDPNTAAYSFVKGLEPLTPSDISSISNLYISVDFNPCFRIPKLSLVESTVNILLIEANYVQFSLSNPLLLYKQSNFPNEGDAITLNVNQYYSDKGLLRPYSSDYQYTPTTLALNVTSYNVETNTGVAIFNNPDQSLILEDSEGRLFEYTISNLSTKLNPVIDDSYLVK